MRVLLVYPNIVESPKDISLGLATLSAVLKKAGHQTKLVDSTFGVSDKEILGIARNFQPELIACTAASNDFLNAERIVLLIKSEFNVPSICGGFHPTVAPESAIRSTAFDMICIGEGEKAIVELARSLAQQKRNTQLNNIWFKENNELTKNPLGKLTENLDTLPFPDRELFDYQKYLNWNQNKATFITSRGCPFQCSYCINAVLQKKYASKGTYVRYRSVSNILNEIKQLKKKYNFTSIEFYDDTFTLNIVRLKEFCERYPKEIGLPFDVNARVNAASKEMFQMLKNAGCRRVSIGIESGDAYIRNKILNRNMTNDEIIQTFKWAKEISLQTYAYNIIGIPYETKQTIQKTIELNREVQPDYVGVSIFNAYPGTRLFDLCKQNNWLKSETAAKSYFRDSNINHLNLTTAELINMRNSFGYKVFKKTRPIRAYIDLLDKQFAQLPIYLKLRSTIIDKLGVRNKL